MSDRLSFGRRAAFGLGLLGAAGLAGRKAVASGIPPVLQYDQMTNVMNFGAVGSGSANDTTAVQNAINAAGQSGNKSGLVFFPGGKSFGINSTLSIPQGVSLIGVNSGNGPNYQSGPNVSRFVALSGFPASTPMVSFADAYQGRFENLVVDGGSIASQGVKQRGAFNSIFRNLLLTNFVNHAASDSVWSIVTTNSNNCAFNLYEEIIIEQPSGATSGLNMVGQGLGVSNQPGAITENKFLSCMIVCGTNAVNGAIAFGSSVDNNYFDACHISGTTGGAGSNSLVILNTTGANSDVQENKFENCVIANGGTGVCVEASHNEDFNFFDRCFFQTAGSITYQFDTGGKMLWKAPSINGVTLLPTVSATPTGSPYTLTNTFPWPVQLIFWGGTYSAISVTRNGTSTPIGATGVVNYTIHLMPTDSVTISYTGSPNGIMIPVM